MRLYLIYIAFTCAARAYLPVDRSIHAGGTKVAGINDQRNAFDVTSLNKGGVSNPPRDGESKPGDGSSPNLLAAGATGDRCSSSDTTRPLERRLDGDECRIPIKDPMTPIKEFIDDQLRPQSDGWTWPLPTEDDPCAPGEASMCCELWYQEIDRTWIVSLCETLNWFRDVCLDNEWHIWCCPLDLFRWGLPHETQGVNCYNPYKPETQPIQPAPALDPVPQVGPF